jgi:hypothetical protein
MIALTCPNCQELLLTSNIIKGDNTAGTYVFQCKCEAVYRVGIVRLHDGKPTLKSDCKHLKLAIYATDEQKCLDCGIWVRRQPPAKPIEAELAPVSDVPGSSVAVK